MEIIKLNRIIKESNTIQYEFSVTKGIKHFFSEKPFFIEYSENIENVPDAVAAIPFVCNVLPIVWIVNVSLIINELDENFYKCLPAVKNGYQIMYPETPFKGEIEVLKTVSNNGEITEKCAAFFSGGLDSVQTLISHLDESPDLISIWGSDVRLNNSRGWERVYSAVEETAKEYQLTSIAIRSSFREFDREDILEEYYSKQLRDGWWHGVKHGIALLGHVAPYAYLHNLSIVYIASSNCAADGKIRCASNPLIDNHVCFGRCKVVHDGFEYNRQDKLHNIVKFCRVTGHTIPLHVCWQSQSGGNCGHCEKCYRTIAGLLAEGENPEKYGFHDIEDALNNMQIFVTEWLVDRNVLKRHWVYIHNCAVKNKRLLQKAPYWKKFKWILKADFSHPEKLRMPFCFRLQRKIRTILQML